MHSRLLKGLFPVLRVGRQHPAAPGVAACTPGARAVRVGAPRVAPWGAPKHPCRSRRLSPGSAACCYPPSPTHSSLSPAWLAGPGARLLHPSWIPQHCRLSPAPLALPCPVLQPFSACRLLPASRVRPDKRLRRAGQAGEKGLLFGWGLSDPHPG